MQGEKSYVIISTGAEKTFDKSQNVCNIRMGWIDLLKLMTLFRNRGFVDVII
jgi:hypothetical protein